MVSQLVIEFLKTGADCKWSEVSETFNEILAIPIVLHYYLSTERVQNIVCLGICLYTISWFQD